MYLIIGVCNTKTAPEYWSLLRIYSQKLVTQNFITMIINSYEQLHNTKKYSLIVHLMVLCCS